MSKSIDSKSGVKILGQVKDGKLVVDAETLKSIGGGNESELYRPVNAPFDPNLLEEAA